MAEQRIPYSYKQLQDHESFRILRLLPCNTQHSDQGEPASDDMLEVELKEVNFSETPDYECLSYTWGSLSLTSTVLVDGKTLPTTRSLETALHMLRKRGVLDTPWIWIDAICINQSDLDERAGQVRLMRAIYSYARRVCAYLGEAANESNHVPLLIEQIILAVEKWQETNHSPDGTPARISEEEYSIYGIPSYHDAAWITLKHFFSRPWFTRVWIVQEVVLAYELILVCGDWALPMEAMIRLARLVDQHDLPFLMISPGPAQRAFEQIGLISTIALYGFERDERTGRSCRPTLSILFLITALQVDNATNPHDNLFALVGISKEYNELELQPNYTLPITETYRQFATYCVRAGKGPDLVSGVQIPRPNLGLPSWVPDLERKVSNYRPLGHEYYLDDIEDQGPQRRPSNDPFLDDFLNGTSSFNTYMDSFRDQVPKAGGEGSMMYVEPCGKRLVAAAYIIDTIESVGSTEFRTKFLNKEENGKHFWETEDIDALAGLEDLAGCLAELALFLQDSKIYAGEIGRKDALLKTILCGKKNRRGDEDLNDPSTLLDEFLATTKFAPNDLGPVIESHLQTICHCLPNTTVVWHDLSEGELFRLCKRLQHFFFLAAAMCEGRRRMRTRTGYVGQIPSVAQPGDVVAIIQGALSPSLIRPNAGAYIMVGQCYLHGFMYGEVCSMPQYRTQQIVFV